MKRIVVLCLAVMVAPLPVVAQEAGSGDMSQGLDLLGEGAKLFLKGLSGEMQPALKDLAQNVEPALRELLGMIDDFGAYEMPERLPNGDIIIRRKTPLPPAGDIEI